MLTSNYLTSKVRNALVIRLCFRLALIGLLLAACDGAPVSTAIRTPQSATASSSTRAPSTTMQAGKTPAGLLPDPTGKPATPAALVSPAPVSTLGASSLSNTRIQFWYVRQGGSLENAQSDLMSQMVQEFNKSNSYGITVEAIPFDNYDDLFQRVSESIYGDLPDLIEGYNYQAANLDEQNKLLVDLTPYLRDPKWGLAADEVSDFYPLFWEQDVFQGKRLGIPLYRMAQVLLYNQTLGESLGFKSPPASAKDFKNQVCAAARTNGKADPGAGVGGWVINTEPPTMLSWLYTFGSPVSGTGASSYDLDNAQTRSALAFLRDLYDQGCAWTAGTSYPVADFASGKALLAASSVAGLPAVEDAFANSDPSGRWTVIPFPPDTGKPAVTVYGPSLEVLVSNSDNQLAAWLLARWLVSAENQARWVQDASVLPVRASAGKLLAAYETDHPQWRIAFDLLPYFRTEPQRGSWKMVRWTLRDAGIELFSASFTAKPVSGLATMLQQTATELDKR